MIKRDSTVIQGTYGEHDNFFNGTYHEMDGNNSTATTLPFVYLDSPSTTSSTTYYLGTRQNANTTYFNRTRGTASGFTSTITLLEIGA